MSLTARLTGKFLLTSWLGALLLGAFIVRSFFWELLLLGNSSLGVLSLGGYLLGALILGALSLGGVLLGNVFVRSFISGNLRDWEYFFDLCLKGVRAGIGRSASSVRS